METALQMLCLRAGRWKQEQQQVAKVASPRSLSLPWECVLWLGHIWLGNLQLKTPDPEIHTLHIHEFICKGSLHASYLAGAKPATLLNSIDGGHWFCFVVIRFNWYFVELFVRGLKVLSHLTPVNCTLFTCSYLTMCLHAKLLVSTTRIWPNIYFGAGQGALE